MKLKDLAARIGAQLQGDGEREITHAAPLSTAGEGSVTFAEGAQHLKDLESSRASAVIVTEDAPAMAMPTLKAKNPRLAFARAVEALHVPPYRPTGVSDKAVIGANVKLGADLSIHPCAVVADNAVIGDRVTLYPGVFVGAGSVIGNDCLIYANVTIREGVTVGNRVILHPGVVIGSDGFGFVTDGGRHHKIPQVGGVILEDDVEIGANSTIDRATLGNTVIRKGSKLDNMVHIAHNVTVGEHCLFAAQVGIAGSTTIGNYVVLGGQVGVADHVTVSDGVMAAGQAGIIRDPGPRQVVGGMYAMPHRDWMRVQAVLPKLPELRKRIAELEKQIRELREREGTS
jgi:UDP-3-O-[3-hydroxymyristoyl] glucosamine N-acyltransferase